MTPEDALELLASATTVAKLTKTDHARCEQAYAVIKQALAALAPTTITLAADGAASLPKPKNKAKPRKKKGK